jgi:hypothetical protein
MKLSTTLALTVSAAVAAFVVGHLTQPGPDTEVVAPPGHQTKSSTRIRPGKVSRENADAAVRAMGKYASCSLEFSAGNAAKLSSEERLDLLANGARVGDYGNQAAMLCGLISVLTKDELSEATDILGNMQDQGNRQAPEVWKSLWRQWGRLNPETCLGFFNQEASGKSRVDARNMMTGWLETNADAALAWARKPEKSPLEASAAALAITNHANGDLKQLESAILTLPRDGETAKVCLEDYFDLASLAGADQTFATIYDQIPPALRPAAWTVAAKRIGYGDSATAKAWVMEHAADPGRNYDGISDLLHTLAYEDPAGTVKWAAQLPFSATTDRMHPAAVPFLNWRHKDPEAASAWMKTQPSDAPWKIEAGE